MRPTKLICTIAAGVLLFSSFSKKDTTSIQAQPKAINMDTTRDRWKNFISLKAYTQPFWKTDTITDETVQVIKDGKTATATLLFKAKKILSVKAANYSKVFAKSKDWEYKNGQLIISPGSAIPFFYKDDLVFTTQKPGHSMDGSKAGTYVLFSEGDFFSARQIAVTYVKEAGKSWEGPVPEFAETTLPNSIGKMEKKENFKVVFYGNSIEVGHNASGFENVPPYMPAWPELVINSLKEKYGGNISFINSSVSGRVAKWGKDSVATRVIAENPDLVIIGFGMNDGTGKVPGDIYREQIKGIIDSVNSQNPLAEFILIAPMLANPASGFVGLQSSYKKELDKLKRKGVVVADLTGVHQELLKHKSYQDMTGNNINHPNDYLARWYAQFIDGILIK